MKVCWVSFKGWGMGKTKILGKDNWQSGLRGLGTNPLKGREATNNHPSDSEALISPWFSISRKERERGLKMEAFGFKSCFVNGGCLQWNRLIFLREGVLNYPWKIVIGIPTVLRRSIRQRYNVAKQKMMELPTHSQQQQWQEAQSESSWLRKVRGSFKGKKEGKVPG